MTTGAYVRVKRDDSWMHVEIDQLTDEELDRLEKEQPDKGWTWAKYLAKWVRDNMNGN